MRFVRTAIPDVVRVEPDVPNPALVVDLACRSDPDADAEKMKNPALEHAAEAIDPRLTAVERQRKVEALVARPVLLRVLAT